MTSVKSMEERRAEEQRRAFSTTVHLVHLRCPHRDLELGTWSGQGGGCIGVCTLGRVMVVVVVVVVVFVVVVVLVALDHGH